MHVLQHFLTSIRHPALSEVLSEDRNNDEDDEVTFHSSMPHGVLTCVSLDAQTSTSPLPSLLHLTTASSSHVGRRRRLQKTMLRPSELRSGAAEPDVQGQALPRRTSGINRSASTLRLASQLWEMPCRTALLHKRCGGPLSSPLTERTWPILRCRSDLG